MIKLHPENGGSPILGDWKESPALYLVGGGSGFRLNSRIEPGDMPLAVLTRATRGVTVAPVHPLCHASAAGQTITTLSSSDSLQLGADHFRIVIDRQAVAKAGFKKKLVRVGVIILALLCGWLLHDFLAHHPSSIATTDLYTF